MDQFVYGDRVKYTQLGLDSSQRKKGFGARVGTVINKGRRGDSKGMILIAWDGIKTASMHPSSHIIHIKNI